MNSSIPWPPNADAMPARSLPRLRVARPKAPSATPVHERDADENAALAALIRAIVARDARALEAFYARSVARVYSLALRIVRCRELAEEVTEDVFLRVWNDAARYDAQRATPIGWLLMLCRSRAIDALRRVDGATAPSDPTLLTDAVADPNGTAEDWLEATQDRQAMRDALLRLSAAQRQLVALAFFRGWTHAELAQRCGLPLGTVKSQLREALKALRHELGALR